MEGSDGSGPRVVIVRNRLEREDPRPSSAQWVASESFQKSGAPSKRRRLTVTKAKAPQASREKQQKQR